MLPAPPGVMLNERGENIIIVVPGANAQITTRDIDDAKPMIRECSVAGFQFENNFDAIEYAIKEAHALGVETMVDPAPVVKFDEELYRYITYMKPNEHEASLLSGIQVSDYETAVRAGRILLDKGVNKAVVITMGEAERSWWRETEKKYSLVLRFRCGTPPVREIPLQEPSLPGLPQVWSFPKQSFMLSASLPVP